ncbi:ATP-dependent nuclease [Desulfofalx alkaliphila]|uniref:ATP-dependent nuclease n=1 Tax=Desulfofalx alkaliphila TaxID=105483 RepID=UPI0004E14B48|nr:AAA family ATPase [Desulfofalx alkaliphila]
MRIKSIKIKNFRSIKKQLIENFGNALILVGKNNCGKSSIINAIRLFWGDYQVKPEDFHKNSDNIEVQIVFDCTNNYLDNLIFNSKIGISKVPSSGTEFNTIKPGTAFEEVSFTTYRNDRAVILENISVSEEVFIQQNINFVDLWKKAITNRFLISNDIVTITVKVKKNELKANYFGVNDNALKDTVELIPHLAFIDDDRNFSEEEVGKSKTITNELFGKHILKQSREGELTCNSCISDDCTDCIMSISDKNIRDLTITDLEKLLKNKMDEKCNDISAQISEFFQRNYKSDYSIYIDPKSNVDSSFSISTKIYDPSLERKIDLSNVGAGVRSIYILSLLEAYHNICKNSNILFLIEEPEIYLHPSLQKNMGKILCNISQDNQVVFSTHSPLLLKDFELKSVLKVSLNQHYETNVQVTDLEGVLYELGYSTEDVLLTEFVIILEGPDDRERLRLIIERFYDLDIDKIFFLDTKSCTNIETYATLRFLGKTIMKDKFLIIRDSDTQDKEVITRKLLNNFRENLGTELPDSIEEKILVLSYSALDNYFLNPTILESIGVINSVDRFYNIIDGYMTSNKENIIRYLNNRNTEERATYLEELLYRDCTPQEKIEDIKKYIRGHDLFGRFNRLRARIPQYINQSSEEDFKEIIEFLDTDEYFAFHKKTAY